MIVIVDYGCGNGTSVRNMIRRAGSDAVTSSATDDIKQATKLILPGVGAFDYGMRLLREKGLDELIRTQVLAGVPVLGICLGMQLLANGSEEGATPGLGLIATKFVRFRFPTGSTLPVPHVGWNTVRVERDNPLIPPGTEERRFYFDHSYRAVCDDATDVIATADYGGDFPAAYARSNIFGVQFHPEKSHGFGLALITRYLKV